MSRFVDGKVILKCKVCANQDCSRDDFPCRRCSDNEQYTSHYKPHKVYQELLDAGVTIAFPKTADLPVKKVNFNDYISAIDEYPLAKEYPLDMPNMSSLNTPCTMFSSEDDDRK